MGRPPPCRPGHGNSKDKINKAIVKGVMSNGGKVEKKTKCKKINDAQSRGQSQSCHQCRQSIHSNKGLSEVKQGKARLKCSSCTRFWCEQCLLNRYGVVKDEANPTTWSCPVCQKMCNCSVCRRKEGKLATGILTPLVKNSGFESVSDFLDKGTTDIAKVLQWSSPAETDAEGKKQPKHSPSQSALPKSRPKTSTHRKSCRNKNHQDVSAATNENDEHFPDNPTNFTPHQSLRSASTSKDQPHRRSTRKRKQSHSYSTEDFRRDSVSPEHSPSVESVACFRSPVCNFKSPNELSPNLERVSKSDEIIEIKITEKLNKEQIETINQKMAEYQQKIKQENERSREEKCLQKRLLIEERAKEREVRAEERKRMIAEKARASEKLKLNKIRAKEKFKLSQGVKRQALKKIQRLQKVKERSRKQELLANLKEKTKAKKWKKLELATTPFSLERSETQVTIVDDNVEECLATGVPSLPSLPPLTLPRIPMHLTPNILFVGEFLHIFSRPLGLKRQLTVTQLATALASGRGMSDVYLALLRVLLDEKTDLRKELRTSKKQRDLEKVAKLYLARNNINGFVSSSKTETRVIDESVQLLDHLCHEALCSAIITEFLDSTKERREQLRREQRTKEKEATKRFGERLKALCDEGGSIEEIKQRREHFTEDLILLRQTFKEELAGCLCVERSNSLGMDRHNRLYWKLQSFPCLLVEAHPVMCGDEDTFWYKVDKRSLLDQLMASLHPAGSREKPLHKSLSFLRDTIIND